jgi:hypothetical protein
MLKLVIMSSVEGYPERIPGIWWFSDDPKNTVPGDLLTKDRRLELNGSFEGMKPGAYGVGKPGLIHARQDRTILGVARTGGKMYTLEYFDEPSFSWATPGYKADTYTLGKIFEGDHFTRTDTLAFERYYVELPYLLEWVNEGIISVQMTIPDSKGHMTRDTSFKIEVGGVKSVNVFKGAKFKISFEIYPEGLKLSAPVKDMNLSQRCVIKLESVGDNLDFVEAGSVFAHIERFLAIAIGRNIEPTKYQASSGSGMESRTVTILTGATTNKVKRRDLSIHEMNFSFSDIKKDSQTIFEKWFNDMRKHADMFDLFSVMRSDLPRNLNNQFKDIVSALEGYVSVESGKLDVSPDKALKTLNEKLPKEDRPISSVDYGRIRITRNKLSHITVKPEDEAQVLEDADKWTNIQRMIFLLEYSLLKGLGLSDAMLAQFYGKRKIYL